MGILNIAPITNPIKAGVTSINGTPKNGTTGATTARTTIPTGATFLRLCSDTAIYFKLGDNTVDAAAGDAFLPANVVETIAVNGATNIAFINK